MGRRDDGATGRRGDGATEQRDDGATGRQGDGGGFGGIGQGTSDAGYIVISEGGLLSEYQKIDNKKKKARHPSFLVSRKARKSKVSTNRLTDRQRVL